MTTNVNDMIKKLERRQRKEVEACATKLISDDSARQTDVDRRAALEELTAYDEELGIFCLPPRVLRP